MRILLLGDYSSLHANLKEGLQELGCDVTTASYGDAWKKIDSDINFSSKYSGLIGRCIRFVKPWLLLPRLINYDVVQLMSPVIFPPIWFYNSTMLKFIVRHNKKAFLLVAGDDCKYYEVLHKFRYSPTASWKKYDNKGKAAIWESRRICRWNKTLLERVDGVIPIMYEYALGYRSHEKLKNTIPIPLNVTKVQYQENIIQGKVVIFHGIIRPGFKGTHIIEQALEIIKDKYPDEVEVVIKGRVSLKDYLKLIERVNIVVDQARSYSYALNALYSLALGKVVLSGCEPECIEELKLQDCPIVNIKPEVEDIVDKLSWLIENKSDIPALGLESRKFVEKYHDYRKVAQQYLDTWYG